MEISPTPATTYATDSTALGTKSGSALLAQLNLSAATASGAGLSINQSESALLRTLLNALQSAAANTPGLASLLKDLPVVQASAAPPAVKEAARFVQVAASPLPEITTEPQATKTISDALKQAPALPLTVARPDLPQTNTPIGNLKVALEQLQQVLKVSGQFEPVPTTPPPSPTSQAAITTTSSSRSETQPPSGVSTPPAAASNVSASATSIQTAKPSQISAGTTQSAPVQSRNAPVAEPFSWVPGKSQIAQSPPAPTSAPSNPAQSPPLADGVASLVMLHQAATAKSTISPTFNCDQSASQDSKSLLGDAIAALVAPKVSSYNGVPSKSPSPLFSRLTADSEPALLAKTLSAKTEAALTQIRLVEVATHLLRTESAQQNVGTENRWTLDLPVSLPPYQTTVHIEVAKDSYRSPQNKLATIWRTRFSLDVDPLGPIQVQIAIMGKNAWISLWAERESSMKVLESGQAMLQQSLRIEDIDAEVICCLGGPNPSTLATGMLWNGAA